MQPGVSLDDAMKRVARNVARATGEKQVPAIYGVLLEDVVLIPGSAPVVETLHTGATRVNPKDGLTYVSIGPGTFMMGCSPGNSECGTYEANPPKPTTISKGFWIGQTDVTQEAYQRVTGSNPSHFTGPKLPVESVNWTDAQNYCEAVGGMRLPTEAEWEYAARAGTKGARYGDLDQIAWYDKNSGHTAHEVANKTPNDWRLYDMLGNVWQWTTDSFNGGS